MKNDQNITCAVFENLALRHRTAQLPAREAALLDAHLQQCGRCANWQGVLRQCRAALDVAADPDLPTSPNVHLQLREALLERQKATSVLCRKTIWYRSALGAAAALLIFFVAGELETPPLAADRSPADGISTVDTPIDSYRTLQQTRESQRLVHFHNEDSLSILRLAPRVLLADSMADSI